MSNKNETLARCRMIWAIMVKTGKTKQRILNRIYNYHKQFLNTCPLCEYLKDIDGDINSQACAKCINWSAKTCESTGGAYNLYIEARTLSEYKSAAKAVLATIDRAIKAYDETGDWYDKS